MDLWYQGFTLSYWPVGSQHWKAERHGVTMNARSKEELKRVIDLHIHDRAAWLNSRK